MSINPIQTQFKPIAPVEDLIPAKDSATVKKGEPSFSEMFSNALKEVDSLQGEAERQIEGITLQKEGFSTHGAMVALEKADVAFQLMGAIRQKIIRAYEDVIRTSV